MLIENKTRHTIIASKAKIADTVSARMIGLLNRSSIEEGEALIITCCNSIHMFFMRFAIDAIFINKNNCVVGLVRYIKPFQLSPVFLQANRVIELPAGVIETSQTNIGDNIDIR